MARRKLTAKTIADRMNREPYGLAARHPWIVAERQFTAGVIPSAQAIGMILSDPDYQAECLLSLRDPREHADAIVRTIWTPRLIENMRVERNARRQGEA